MTHRTWNSDRGPLSGLYRDRENGWFFGVCAGIADRFNLRLCAVRAVAIVSLVLFFWATALLYIFAAILIREKPLIYSGRASESEFWRHRSDYWRHS